jgi:hypothetical protein
MLVIVSVASAFLLWDCYVSAATDVPKLGVFGYLTATDWLSHGYE